MKELTKVFNSVKSDLCCIDWSETDGSDVKKLLKSAFTPFMNHKPEIIEMFNKTSGMNVYQKTMIIDFLRRM